MVDGDIGLPLPRMAGDIPTDLRRRHWLVSGRPR